jgi:hypothetical protein
MGISPDGVKFHVSEILSRTGASRRREAAEWSRERERPTAMLGGWRTRGVELRRWSCCDRRAARLLVLEQERIAC